MVGIIISNEENVQDKAIGISFRRRDKLTPDVIWSVFGKVAQSNPRFNALDKLILNIYYVKMPIIMEVTKSLLRVDHLLTLHIRKEESLKLKLKNVWPTP
jgi:hypothetical protein